MKVSNNTKSVCPGCAKEGKIRKIDAKRVEEDGKVFLVKECPKHGKFKSIISDELEEYKKYQDYWETGEENTAVKNYGLYDKHYSQSVLTNLFVTNRCNLRCSYCFANAGAEGFVYEPSLEQLKKQMKMVREEKPVPSKAIQLSLDGEEKIPLKNEKGHIVYRKIGEFIDEYMKNPKRKNTPIYHERESISGWKTLSIDKNLKTTFKPINEIIRHKVKGNLFEIVTENGNRIRTTGSHSVFVLTENGLEAKPVSELIIGDQLIQSLKIPEKKDIDRINLIDKLKNSPYEDKIRIYPKNPRKVVGIIGREIGKTVGLHEVKSNLNDFDFEQIAWYNSKKEKILPAELIITPELSRLMGYYTSEGCCYAHGLIFSFDGEEEELIEDLINCVRKVFGKTNIRKREEHGGSEVQIYVEGYLYKILFEYILNAGKYSKKKRIPWIVYNLPEELQKEFLRAYFRGDGHVRTRDAGYQISFNTSSKELAYDLLLLNQQLGIIPRISTSISKEHFNNVTGKTVSKSKKHVITIGGKEQLSKSLWLLNEKEKEKFKSYLDRKERHAPKRERVEVDLEDLWEKRHKFSNSQLKYLLKRAHQDKSVSKKNLTSITGHLKEESIPFNHILNDVSHSNLGFVKVREINEVKPSSEYVYDLSVNGDQFFSGLGLLLAHNTGGEPTVRDDLPEIIKMADEMGFSHIQLNTNGIKVAEDPKVAEEWKEAGCDTIYMSFDGVKKKTNPWIQQNKKAIENFRKAGLNSVVLVPVVIKNHNDDQLGDIIKFAAENLDVVRGVNFQPVSFVGRLDKIDDKTREKERISFSEVHRKVEEQTNGAIKVEDWYPPSFVNSISDLVETIKDKPQVRFGCSPNCGSATYAFLEDDELIPITRFVDVEGLRDFIKEKTKTNGILKKARIATSVLKNIGNFLDEEKAPSGFSMKKLLVKAVVGGDYDSLGEFHHKSLYIGGMWFQDPWNLDIQRLKRCVIHYATPEGVIPFCIYNGLGKAHEIRKRHSVPIEEWEKKTGKNLKDDLWKNGPLSP